MGEGERDRFLLEGDVVGDDVLTLEMPFSFILKIITQELFFLFRCLLHKYLVEYCQ